MSYILDALKKSEQERQQDKSPNLHSVHRHIPGFQNSPSKKGKKMVFATLLILVMVTGGGISYYLFHPLLFTAKPETKTDSQQVPPLSNPSSVTDNTNSPIFLGPAKKKVIYSQATPPTQQLVSTTQTTKKARRLPYVLDLPPEIQSNIPKISLAGHTYSDTPTQRMVILNNKILREGDKVDTNIRLIEITWEGVILDYDGTRFQQDTK